MAEYYSIVYTYHVFLTQSSVDEYLGCFHVLAIVNSAARNIQVHASFWIVVLSGYMPRSGIAGSCGSSISIHSWPSCWLPIDLSAKPVNPTLRTRPETSLLPHFHYHNLCWSQLSLPGTTARLISSPDYLHELTCDLPTPLPLCSSRTASLLVLQPAKHSPASEPLPMWLLMPHMFFPQ